MAEFRALRCTLAFAVSGWVVGSASDERIVVITRDAGGKLEGSNITNGWQGKTCFGEDKQSLMISIQCLLLVES